MQRVNPPPTKKSWEVAYDTKLQLTVKLQFWTSKSVEYSFITSTPSTPPIYPNIFLKIIYICVILADEIPSEVWKTRQFDDILLRHCNTVYNQNLIDRWMKGYILPFPKTDDLRLAKNYRGITLTSIAAKIYNALLRNRIEPKIDNILRKNQNGFRRNRSTTSKILTIREGIRAKNLQATLLFVDFTKAFDSIHRGKMEQILLAYGLQKETVAAITILYSNTKVKVRSPDGDRILRIVAGVLQRDTLAPLYHLSRLCA